MQAKPPSPRIIARDGKPETVIPILLDYLRSLGIRGTIKANWVEDVYSEVIKAILSKDISDPSWIDSLYRCLCEQLDLLAQTDSRLKGYSFGYEPSEGWGWSPR